MRFTIATALFVGVAVAGVAPPADSTVYSTAVATITSCPPEKPDCPATSKPAAPTKGPHGGNYTTSTVYSTKTYTITSCAPEVTDCPAGKVTTSVIAVSTTVCPVSEVPPPSKPTESPKPPKPEHPKPEHPKPEPSKPASPGKPSDTCPVSTVTVTVTAGKPPHPSGTGHYPTGPSKPVYPTGTGAPPKPTSPPKFTGAANSVTGGAFVAGVGALAAFFL